MGRQELVVTIDRPIGFQDSFGTVYPINYGYVPDIIGGDGEEQDVYILNETIKLENCVATLIAIIHRRDDVETKWVATTDGSSYTAEEIMDKVHFIEQYFDSYVELLDQK